MNVSTNKFIQIDEEGYFSSDGVRVTDADYGRSLLEGLNFNDYGSVITRYQNQIVFVEAFDEPLVIKNLEPVKSPSATGQWQLLCAYGHKEILDLQSENHQLSLDEWDRFHGKTSRGIPFVFSRAAQASFFDQLEEFDDDSITWQGQRIDLPPWLQANPEVESPKFWTDIYENEIPRWELNAPAKALVDTLAQLKLPKSRILVLGAGSCEDAAFFAKNGHLVTAVDFSPSAIAAAQKKFSDVSGIQWVQADAFSFLEKSPESFDLIFEHTFFCAINPCRRSRLMKLWHRALAPGGHLLGVFFVHPKTFGPPYGGSEWELRQRFEKQGFRQLYWTRWKHSIENRVGKELVIYSQKK